MIALHDFLWAVVADRRRRAEHDAAIRRLVRFAKNRCDSSTLPRQLGESPIPRTATS
jgi:hypothetical protein